MKFDSKTQIITFETADPLHKLINPLQPHARTSHSGSHKLPAQNAIELSSLSARLETVFNRSSANRIHTQF